MIAVVQRVSKASVSVDSQKISSITSGFLVLLGAGEGDTEKDVDYISKKVANLRIMADREGKMNKSLGDVSGEVLLVSQFTLYGSTKKGNRPSFVKAAEPKLAEKLYILCVNKLKQAGIKVKTGSFGAMMQVSLINDGPVTIILKSHD